MDYIKLTQVTWEPKWTGTSRTVCDSGSVNGNASNTYAGNACFRYRL